MSARPFPVQRAAELPTCPPDHRWLIHDLWADQAVGIVGGEPKLGKSLLALDMVVAVAGGVPCLRRFAPARCGPVLVYAAEDALHLVRTRLESICAAAHVRLPDLPIHVITTPSVRLDLLADRQRLQATIAVQRPILLVLDPFVRLHRIDENASSEVAPILAYLRELQRCFALAVAVVHHARKGAHAIRAGQALRGTSEFHAWGDSNLYLRRLDDRLLLSIEQRAAPSQNDLPVALQTVGQAVALHLVDTPSAIRDPSPPPSPVARVETVLAQSDHPLTFAELRQACRMRTAVVCQALAALTAQDRLVKSGARYQLRSSASPDTFPTTLYTARETETGNGATSS
jgi:hypothetical protein